MSKGIVYILINPCLDGWVKIGMTERSDIDGRLKELNTPTNLPLSYRCYAAYEVEQPLEVEKRIHSIIDRINDTLHAREQLENGRIRCRINNLAGGTAWRNLGCPVFCVICKH